MDRVGDIAQTHTYVARVDAIGEPEVGGRVGIHEQRIGVVGAATSDMAQASAETPSIGEAIGDP